MKKWCIVVLMMMYVFSATSQFGFAEESKQDKEADELIKEGVPSPIGDVPKIRIEADESGVWNDGVGIEDDLAGGAMGINEGDNDFDARIAGGYDSDGMTD